MELLNTIIMLSVLTVAFYFILKKEPIDKEDNLKKIKAYQNQTRTEEDKQIEKSHSINNKVESNNSNGVGVDVYAIEQEVSRRKKIISNVKEVLDNSIYFEPIAKWKEKDIYQFIFFNNQDIFEFEDIMPPENQRIGVDDDFLCFQQLFYKKINDRQKIELLLNKFESTKGEKVQYNFN